MHVPLGACVKLNAFGRKLSSIGPGPHWDAKVKIMGLRRFLQIGDLKWWGLSDTAAQGFENDQEVCANG